jgi:hypothetical protein
MAATPRRSATAVVARKYAISFAAVRPKAHVFQRSDGAQQVEGHQRERDHGQQADEHVADRLEGGRAVAEDGADRRAGHHTEQDTRADPHHLTMISSPPTVGGENGPAGASSPAPSTRARRPT